MTYQELQAALQAYQAANGGATYTPMVQSGYGEGASYAPGEPVANNLWQLGDKTAAQYDPATNSYLVAEGDARTGGIARTRYYEDGRVEQLPFEPIDFSANRRGDIIGALAAGAAVAGAGALAAGAAGAGAGAAGGAGSASGVAAQEALMAQALSGSAGTTGWASGAGAAGAGAGATGGMFSDALASGASTGYGSNLASMPTYLDAMPSMGSPMAGGFGSAGTAGALGTAGAGAGMFSNVLNGGGGGTSNTTGGMDWSKILSDPRLLAAGAGAVAGIAGNDDMNISSTSTSGLAPWLQPYAQDYLSRAQALAGQPTTNVSMDTARGLMSQYATQGDPLVNQARSQQANVIGGGMLGANPYLDDVARRVGDRMGEAYATGTRAGIDSSFLSSGNNPRYSSAYGQTVGNADRAFGDSLGLTLGNIYNSNYQNERSAQDAAARASLGFGNFATGNAQNLYNVGTADWARPYMQNQYYGQAINPAYGSTSTNTQNIQAPNNWMAGAGGALAGASIYNSIYGRR